MEYKLNEQEKARLIEIETEMLRNFLMVCEKLNLRYFMLGGTALGTVRHNGFIPWDDDIDVGMPRYDYEIFMSKAQELLPNNIFVQNIETDKEYPHNFAKLRNCDTIFKEQSVAHLNINHGVYLDIFPLDGYPSQKIAQRIFRLKNAIYLSRIQQIYNISPTSFKGKIIANIGKISCSSPYKAVQKRERLLKSYSYDSCFLIANYCGAWGDKEIMPRDIFGAGYTMTFESIDVNIPQKYDIYLKSLYGNYMKFPPLESRVGHHFCEKVNLYSND